MRGVFPWPFVFSRAGTEKKNKEVIRINRPCTFMGTEIFLQLCNLWSKWFFGT